ncbi:MAG: 30S ribosomal protein S27ae [Nanopusillaceae archaeon]
MAKKQEKAYVTKYYKIDENKVIKLKKICPNCSVYMAEHKDRYHCGNCGYTEFKAK